MDIQSFIETAIDLGAECDGAPLLRGFARCQAHQVVHLWNAPEIVILYLRTGDEAIRDLAHLAAKESCALLDAHSFDARLSAIAATSEHVYDAAILAAKESINALAAHAAIVAGTASAADAAQKDAHRAHTDASKRDFFMLSVALGVLAPK